MFKKFAPILIVLFMLSACTVPSVPTDDSESKTTSATSAETELKKESEPEPEPEPEPETYEVGETVTLNDFEITVDSWEATKKISSNAYVSFNADEGSTFIVVSLTIKNVGTSANILISTYPINRNDAKAKIYYQDEYEYTGTNLLGYDGDLHDKQQNPLESKTGVLVFSLPDEAAESEDLTFVLSADKTSYTFKLN